MVKILPKGHSRAVFAATSGSIPSEFEIEFIFKIVAVKAIVDSLQIIIPSACHKFTIIEKMGVVHPLKIALNKASDEQVLISLGSSCSPNIVSNCRNDI